MNISDIICLFILIAVIILDVIDIGNLSEKRKKDKNLDMNKGKYTLSYLLYVMVIVLSVYFIFSIVFGNFVR